MSDFWKYFSKKNRGEILKLKNMLNLLSFFGFTECFRTFESKNFWNFFTRLKDATLIANNRGIENK